MNNQNLKSRRRLRRKYHIKSKISGSSNRLRLTVFRSLNHIYAQIINDNEGKTIVSASTLDKEVKADIKPEMRKLEVSKLVGKHLALRAKDKGVNEIRFDRNGYIYHGRVKALADAVREGGLKF